jgi:hypothetical protein
MQIGRITNLPEMTSLAMTSSSTVSITLIATETQARQLLDQAANTSERYVTITSTAQPDLDGLYEVLAVSSDADPSLDKSGRRQVTVEARCENRGQQVANAVLLVRGDNRNRVASTGVTSPLYRVHYPSGTFGTDVFTFNAGPAGVDDVNTTTLTTMRGSLRRLNDRTQAKTGVRAATTANITLSAPQTIDGVAVVAGDRVLVKNQTTASTNGIYVVAAGAWTRATDADTNGTSTSELDYAHVGVQSGTANGGTTWFLPQQVTIGTTAQTWQQAPAFGLRESNRGGPVSISYALALDKWYNGACTMADVNGDLLTGLRAPTRNLTFDNGLIAFSSQESGSHSSLYFKMASGSPQTWQTNYTILDTISAAAILANTPDLVAVRFRAQNSNGPVLVDVSILRGSRTATIVLTPQGANDGRLVIDHGASPAFTLLSGSGEPGYTNPVNHMAYLSSNDVSGNRIAVSGTTTLTTGSASPAGAYVSRSSGTARTHVYGLHAIVGGGTTYTGVDQLYPMNRAWYAMLAQQTSAGVL